MQIKLQREGTNHKVKLEILSRPVIDTVIKVAPIAVLPADTLQVTYDLLIEGYVDDVCTSTLNEKFSYIFKLGHEITVQYIRFTKYKRKASIQVYEEIPDDYYKPPGWNAKKVYKK